MTILRWVFAILAIVFGTAGTLACAAGVIGLWSVRDRVERQSTEIVAAVSETLDAAEEKLSLVGRTITRFKNVVGKVNQKITELEKKGDGPSPADRKEMREFEKELAGYCHKIEVLVEVSKTAVDMLAKTLHLANAVPARLLKKGRDLSAFRDLRDTAETLAELSKKLESLSKTLSDIREDKVLQKEVVSKVKNLSGELNTRLTRVDNRLSRAHEQLSELSTTVRETQPKLPEWIRTIVIGASLVFLWIGLGQVALLFFGFRMTRDSKDADQAEAGAQK